MAALLRRLAGGPAGPPAAALAQRQRLETGSCTAEFAVGIVAAVAVAAVLLVLGNDWFRELVEVILDRCRLLPSLTGQPMYRVP